MFILESVETKDLMHFLYGGSKLLVSRIKGHVVLPNDKSVSREHANLSIVHYIQNLSDCRNHPQVYIEDLGSKYGTFLNEGISTSTKLEPYTVQQLCQGDTIRFGLLKNSWKLSYKHIVTCSSLVENLSEAKAALQSLGGHLLKDWTTDCNLLLMQDLFLTAKAVCALSSCSNIVIPDYLTKLLSAVQSKQKHPVPLSYRPPLKEICIGKENVSFVPDMKRKVLFKDKNFIFCSLKSMNKLKSAVLLSGGTVELLSSRNVNLLLVDGNILVNPFDLKIKGNELINKANDILQKNSLSPVPESDIGLAIVHVSTVKFCNPKFKVNNLLCRNKGSQPQAQNFEIYATETQDDEILPEIVGDFSPVSRTVVTESGQSTRRTPFGISSVAPSISNQLLPSLPNMLPSLPNITPSVPRSSTREFFMDETNMSTQPRNISASPAKMEKHAMKRERLSSDSSQSPLNKKRNVAMNNENLPDTLNINADTQQQIRMSTTVTQPFAPSFCCSMQADEPLFEMPFDSPSFMTLANFEDRDTKPSLGVSDLLLDPIDHAESCESPHPHKRKPRESSAIFGSPFKKPRSHDDVDCSQSTLRTTPDDANPFALVVTTARRRRKSVQSVSTTEMKDNLEEKQNVERLSGDINANSTTMELMPAQPKETIPFIATQIKNEESAQETVGVDREKSLVVVEIVNLVKQSFSRLSIAIQELSTSVTAPNFKRFKKTFNGTFGGSGVSLPRIIGGGDLVLSIDENQQKEIFLASQQSRESSPTPVAIQINQMVDNDFNLPMPKRSRTRMR